MENELRPDTDGQSSLERYHAWIERAVSGLEPTTVRLYRREARRFGAWCVERESDPLRPSATEIATYFAVLGADRRRAAAIRSALRAVARTAGVPADEHGLGTGDRSVLLTRLNPGATVVVQHVLDGSAPRRTAVTRSALAKLAAWAVECEVDLLALAPVDLDDYGRWLTRVGSDPSGELMVVARRFLRASADLIVRGEVARVMRRSHPLDAN